MLRWAVNVGAWAPTPAQWQLVLDCLPAPERERCLTYRQPADQKRAVVSQLLQRAAVSRLLGVEWRDVAIKRTKGSKPFYAGPATRADAPNFNYNVSHEGDFVVLACEAHCLCGVDVAAPQQLRCGTKPLLDVLSLMRSQLTAAEWEHIQSLQGDEAAMEAAFQAIWSVKEAFIKARGDGVAFELHRLHVTLPPQHCSSAQGWVTQPVQPAGLAIDGVPQQGTWAASLQQLPRRHWVSVVRGPPDAAIDALGEFSATFREPHLPPARLQQLLGAPSPLFDLMEVEDVLPDHLGGRYHEIGAGYD